MNDKNGNVLVAYATRYGSTGGGGRGGRRSGWASRDSRSR